MLKPFSIRRLHNAELITFYNRFLKILSGASLPVALVTAVGVLERFAQAIDAGHVGDDESEMSDEMRDIDAARDEQYSGLSQLADAFCTSKVPEKRAAGSILAGRFADYGTVAEVTEQGGADESGDLRALLRDLRERPELAAAAAIIGAADWLEELDRLNTLYEEKALARNALRGKRLEEQPENIETLRPKAEEAYRTVCRKVNSFADTDEGSAQWTGLTSEINALFADTRNILAARRGRAKASASGSTQAG
jgi:hypothetical protein